MVRLIVVAAVALALPASANADIVVPGAYASQPAGGNVLPFDIGPTQERLQQLYSASVFGTTPIQIYGIAFRPAFGGKAFNATLPAIKISLSTSPRKVGVGDDVTFADYIGADARTVIDGPLTLHSAFVAAAGGTQAFDISIRFASPFAYDPTQGDLLIDIVNTGGGTTTPFDLVSLGAPSIDQLYTYRGSEPVTLPTGHARPGGGLITDFLTTPTQVSEASSLGVLGAGPALAVSAARRRKASV